MNILILNNQSPDASMESREALVALQDADIAIAWPEGGEPVVIKHRDIDPENIKTVVVDLPTAAEINAKHAREMLEERLGKDRTMVESEAPLVKATRVWDDLDLDQPWCGTPALDREREDKS